MAVYDLKKAAVKDKPLLPPITIVVVTKCLQKDDDEGHQRLNQAELQRGLLAEAQETDRIGLALQAAGTIQTRRLDGLPADLRHDVALTSKVLVAQRQEVVDDKGCVETRTYSPLGNRVRYSN